MTPNVDVAKIRVARTAIHNSCNELYSFYNNTHINHNPVLSRLFQLPSETDALANRSAGYAKNVVENMRPFQPGDPIHRSIHVLDGIVAQGRQLVGELKPKWSNDHFTSFYADLNDIKTDFRHKADAVKRDIDTKNHHSEVHKSTSIAAGTFAGVAAASLIAAPFTLGLSMAVFAVSSAVSIGTGIGAGINGHLAESINIEHVDYDGAIRNVDNIISNLHILVDELILFNDYWLGLVDLIDLFVRDLKKTVSDPSEPTTRALRRLHEYLDKHPDVDENTVLQKLEDETCEGYANRLWLAAMVIVVRVRS